MSDASVREPAPRRKGHKTAGLVSGEARAFHRELSGRAAHRGRLLGSVGSGGAGQHLVPLCGERRLLAVQHDRPAQEGSRHLAHHLVEEQLRQLGV